MNQTDRKPREAKSPPKLGFVITEEQQSKLKDLLPYGLKQQVFGAITADLISILEGNPERRGDIISLLITNQLKFSEISPFLKSE